MYYFLNGHYLLEAKAEYGYGNFEKGSPMAELIKQRNKDSVRNN